MQFDTYIIFCIFFIGYFIGALVGVFQERINQDRKSGKYDDPV